MFSKQSDLTTAAGLCQGEPGEHWIGALDDGTHVLIRPLEMRDRERQFAFIQRLSWPSRRFRFLRPVTVVGESLLDHLMDVDYHYRMAYIALAHEDGELREIGVCHYAANPEEKVCECAIVVADDWQRRGLGRLLMTHLIEAARRNGFKEIVSTNLSSNYAIHRLLKKLGFESYYPTVDFSEIVHKLRL